MKFKIGDSVMRFKVALDDAKFYDLFDYVVEKIDTKYKDKPYLIKRTYDNERFWVSEEEIELNHDLDELY